MLGADSSVAAAPSNRSLLPGYTKALLSERVRPRPPPSNRTHKPVLPGGLILESRELGHTVLRFSPVRMSGFCSTGAAEDGRAPTEELSCIQARDFCSTGAAEDAASVESSQRTIVFDY